MTRAHRTRWRLVVASFGLTALLGARISDAKAPAGRYTIANGTVYDTLTKLTWQQSTTLTTYSQSAAASTCAALVLAGSGWRLPTAKELVTIMDVGDPSMIDTTAFQGDLTLPYWSSTAIGQSGYQVTFDVNAPPVSYAPPSTGNYVRCVRP